MEILKKTATLLTITTLVIFIATIGLNTSTVFADTDSKKVSSKTLKNILKKGEVWVGVIPDEQPGFFEWQDQNGVGLEADLARALAAAIFADIDRVRFIRASSWPGRFTDLNERQYDVLLSIATFTLSRDTSLNVNFGPVYFFGGQIIMTNAGLQLEDLDGETIGVLTGSVFQDSLATFMEQRGVNYTEVLYSDEWEMISAYVNEEVQAVTLALSLFYYYQTLLTDPENHVVLDEMLSIDPLSPVVRHGDDAWYDIVKWVIYALFKAEELGITSGNVEALKADPLTNQAVKRFLGVEGTLGDDLGLPNDWAYQIIKLVGNYGEIYDDNMGPNTQRGPNSLYTEGGLLYSPPMQ